MLADVIHITALIHPLAHVEKAQIGARTRVWQFASVIRGAVIGDDGMIASCAIVDGAALGHGCRIGHGASVPPGVIIEDDVFVGPGVVFCNDMWPSVAKDGFDLDLLCNRELVTIRVQACASVGAGAIVLPGVTIGYSAVIAAGAVVDRPVPAGCLFKRDGDIVAIEPTPLRRMRQAMPC